MAHDRAALDALLTEKRKFAPPPEFAAAAVVSDPAIYETAEDYEAFWEAWAGELDWFRKWDSVLEWDPPHARWFDGGKLNVCHNCVDRHLDGPRRDKIALVWEGEPCDMRSFTYAELADEVGRFANVLRGLGVKKGDRVAIYLPMIPEAAFAMLACARVGAPHSVVFGGFSPDSLADRINDAGAKVLVTADGGYRRGKIVPLKDNADRAVARCPGIEHVVVVARGGDDDNPVEMRAGRDHWYHDLAAAVDSDCPAEAMDAEDILYILYTSGTTGKPKGVVHTTGGYLTQVHATARTVFDLRDDDVYWCTADVGWVTGHSYVVYGPLAAGATVLMYEGAPDWPDRGRIWEICEDHGVTVFYTAPHRDPRLHAVGGRLGHAARPVPPAPAGHGGRAHQPRGVDVVSPPDRRGALPDRRHLVADRDGGDHDHAAAGRHPHAPRQRVPPVPGDRGHAPERRGANGSTRATWPSPAPGRRCCAPSGATTGATGTPTGRSGKGCTSPATAPGSTRTATCGSWAGWTTC